MAHFCIICCLCFDEASDDEASDDEASDDEASDHELPGNKNLFKQFAFMSDMPPDDISINRRKIK